MLPDLGHCDFISLVTQWVVRGLRLLRSSRIPAEKTVSRDTVSPQDPVCEKIKFSHIQTLFVGQRDGSAGKGACRERLRIRV